MIARPIVIAADLSKTFRLQHQRVLSVKERVMNALRGRGGADEEFVALDRVTFEVVEGESVALVGRNGSGKSTLLKLIAGIHHATGGRLLVRAGLRIATMIELGIGFHPDLSGRENVFLNASIHGLSREEIDAVYPRIVAYAELERFIDNPTKTYSSGMVMRLGFAVSIHLNPDMFLLDEIFAVGDESFQSKCLASMREFQSRGKTMFFVSHSADAVRDMCDRAIVIERGQVQFDGDTDAGIKSYRRLLAHAEAGGLSDPLPGEATAERDAARGPCWHRRVVGELWDEAGERHLAFLREQGLAPSQRVLDVGCGCLRTGVRLLRYLEPGRYVGVDRDAAIVEAGRTIEAPMAGVDPGGGQYVIGDASDLSGVEGRFDAIWVNGLLQDLSHEQAVLMLASAVRHLAPGGRVFAAYFEAPFLLATDPIERPGPSFSHFDRVPRHFDVETLSRYADAAGGRAVRLGDWGDPHGQSMLVVTRKADLQTG